MKTRFLLLALPALCSLLSLAATAQPLSSLTMQLATPGGEKSTVAKLGTGKVTMVSFWATWCKPCKEEMKAMQPIFEKMKDNFQYIAVSIDNTKTMAKVAPYIKSQGYTFPVLLDPNSELFLNLNGTNVPYTLIYDATGKLIAKHDGYLEGDQAKIESELDELVKKMGAAPSTQSQQ